MARGTTANGDPNANDTPNLRRSHRVPQPARKVVEALEQEHEAQNARIAAREEAAARAEKRPRQYSVDELEALVDKRRKEVELDQGANPNNAQPLDQRPPRIRNEGINMKLVNRLRETSTVRNTAEPFPARDARTSGLESNTNSPVVSVPQPLPDAPTAVLQQRDGHHAPASVVPVAVNRPERSRPVGSSAARGSAPPAEPGSHPLETPTRPASTLSRVSSWSSLRSPTPSLPQGAASPSPLARHASYDSLHRPVPQTVSQPSFTFGDVDVAGQPLLGPNPAPSAPTGAQSAQTVYHTHQGIEAYGRTPIHNHHPQLSLADNATFGDHPTSEPTSSSLGFDPGHLYPARASMRGVSVAPSPSPTPPPVTIPVLHPDDDPKSSTYGNGEGLLLMPRQTIRTKPDTKGMSKAERKQVNNSMRAKGEDFGRTENRILTEASSRLSALIPCQDPLPTAESEEAMAEECWGWARQSLGKRITHNRDLLSLLKRNYLNQRTQTLSAASKKVTSFYEFKVKKRPSDNEEEFALFNRKLAAKLLDRDCFIFKDVDEREDAFQHEVIEAIILKIWFNDKKAPGARHPDLFFPITITPLAYVLTIIEKSIKEWSTGTHNSITFSSDTHRARFQYYRGELKRYRDHKAIQEEHIFSDYIIALERAARKHLRQMASKTTRGMRFDGETSSEDEKPPTQGLDEEDILRSLRKRKLVGPKPKDVNMFGWDAGNSKGKEPNPLVADSSMSGENTGTGPGYQSGGGGFASVGFAGMSQNVPGGTFLGLNRSHAPPEANSTGEPWGSPMMDFNASQSSCSTIYPGDSVSQQMMFGNASGYGGGNGPEMGFLEQMHDGQF